MRNQVSVHAESRWSAQALQFLMRAGLAVGALTGCYVTPGQPQVLYAPGGPVPMQGGPPSMQGGPIEAGCSYNGLQLPGSEAGLVFQVACPPGCQDTGGLWGTDIYTADSGICRAGIHAGVISSGGGVVQLRLEPGRPAYRGSVRNNISSSDYGNYARSYTFFAPQGQAGQPQPAQPQTASAPPPVAPQVIEAFCSYNSLQIRDAPGTTHLVSCPPNCAGVGGLWGTDVYTGDSAVCRAAIHAGLINNNTGGMVVVFLDGGRPAYRGSARNGERSSDYGNYAVSFSLQPAR